MENLVTDLLKKNAYTSFDVAMSNGSFAINLFVGQRLATTIATQTAGTTLQLMSELKNQGLAAAEGVFNK